MKPNKFTNLFISIIFSFYSTLNALILSNSIIKFDSVSIVNSHNFANANMNIASNEFINSSKITAKGDININSNNFINQTLFINDKANLNANNIFINAMANISNLGGDIVTKNNLVLNTLGDIANSINLNYYANDCRKTYSTTTDGELNANTTNL